MEMLRFVIYSLQQLHIKNAIELFVNPWMTYRSV
uniref:Uncharacterized protein n=1 Tax=Arundo donax TaxID=35708 RepID=A0A0A9H4B1_ARUDO